jgi:murein DD-endopeptidase MepM/ murein hydrolase activator NlpD
VGGRPARRSGAWVALILGALVLVNLYVFVWDTKTSVGAIRREAESRPPAMALPSAPLVAPPPIVPAPVGPPGAIDGKVGKSDTLGRLLKKAGLSAAEADEVIRSLSGVLDFKAIRGGQTYHLERGADGRVKKFELVVNKLSRVQAVRDQQGSLIGTSDSAQTKLETKAIGGRIASSLYAAIKASGESAALVDFFVDVFAYDLDFFNDTHEGDTFRVVVEKELKLDQAGNPGDFLRYKRILAAEYQGKAGTFRTYFWNGAYYDASGESAEKSLLKTPLKFSRVSSGFDRARMHPVLHTLRAHLGIDYAAPVGTPVWAAAAGTITQRAMAGGAGNLVMLKHEGGIETAYMHLSKFAAGQEIGQHVEAKTVIGYVGATGLATGPHLHFGVRKDGNYIDPTKLPAMHGKAIAAKDADAFKAEIGKLEKSLAAIVIEAPKG